MAFRSATINVMVRAAFKAAPRLVRDFGEVEQLQVSKKGPADFVSSADLRAERKIVDELRRARPTFGFLLEERGEIPGEDPDYRWVVDPLDGTTNFLHGIPHFAISIALQKGEEVIAGVIYDPVKDELFWAERGQGAWMNDHRLRVSSRSDFAESVLLTGIPHKNRGDHDEFLAISEEFMSRVAGIRRFGAASLDLAYVAAGRGEGYWELGLHPWDIAAGDIIVREAGGFISDYEGRNRAILKGEVLAANDSLHPEMVKLIKAVRRGQTAKPAAAS